MSGLSHFDDQGRAHMVDVSEKSVTARVAVAEGYVNMAPQTLETIMTNSSKKGDVLGVARLAGISGAKQTSSLIPLCHPLPLTHLAVDLTPQPDQNRVHIVATAKTTGQTGVEMEALTAVSVASLTVYDMVKAVDKSMSIDAVRLVLKDGGASGRYEADA